MKIGWYMVFGLLYLYRCAFSVLGQTVVMNFTTLGDARRYQGRATGAYADSMWRDSTNMTDTLGAVFQVLSAGQPILVNIWFQSVAFIGLVVLAMATAPRYRGRLVFLFFMPSFSLWTSVASKESVVVLGMGLLCTFIVGFYRGQVRVRWYHLLGLYIVLLYKPHYLAAVVFLFAGSLIADRVRQKGLLALTGGLVSLVPLFLLAEQLQGLAEEVQYHFASEADKARSTRTEFFIEQYDVLTKIPEGLWLSFFGPTLREASISIVHMASLVEAVALVMILLYFMVRRFFDLPAYSFFMGLFTAFWILFANYPFGVMNAGTAIRYRSGYVILIFVVFAVLLSRDSYAAWREGRRRRIRRPAVPAGPESPVPRRA